MKPKARMSLFRMSTVRLGVGILGGTLLSFLLISQAEAANYYWAGGTSDRWESAANWASVPKGAGGAGVPGSSDVAILASSGGTVRLRSQVRVGGLILAQVWTGSLLQGTGTLTVGTSGVRVGSGRLIGGNASFAIAGSYTQTGGIVSGLQNTFVLSGSVVITKGGLSSVSSFNSTGTIIMDGQADQNFTVGADVSKSFNNFTVWNFGGGSTDDVIVDVDGGFNLSGTLLINYGNLDLATNSQMLVVERGITLNNNSPAQLTTNSNVTVSGSILVNDAATISVSGGTWTLNDDGDQSVDFDGQHIVHLTINNTGGGSNDDVIIAGGGLNLSGALTVTLGHLDLDTNSQSLSVDDDVILGNSAQATLSGATMNFGSGLTVHPSATFTHTSGTVTLDGTNQTLSGSITFHNLTKNATSAATLTFAATTTQTITDTLTLNGAASNLLSLRSSQTGTQWKINPQATRTVSYLDVKDSNNTNATAISCTTTCTDSGNNTNWTLTVASSSSSTADSGGTSGGGGGGGGRRGAMERIQQVLQGQSSSSAIGDHSTSSSNPFLSFFNDVPRDAWYAPYVIRLKSRGIISGYKDAAGNDLKKFGPANSTTYAEIAKMVLLLSSQSPSDTTPSPFHWATSYIAKARSLGFSLYPPSLNIDAPASRGAVIQTMLEAYRIPPLADGLPNPFSDLPVNHRFTRALLTAHSLGIISGDAVAEGKPRTVRPDASVNRAEVAKILFLFSEKYPAPLSPLSAASASFSSSSSQSAQPPQATGKTYRVGTPTLNLRADARIDASVLRVLKAGNIVTLLTVEYGTWAYVRLPDGLLGYVWLEHLREE